MKQVLRILNSLVVLTISSITVIACWNETNTPPIIPHSDERFRNQIAELEAQKVDANNDEIIIINQKNNRLVAEWVTIEISFLSIILLYYIILFFSYIFIIMILCFIKKTNHCL